MNRGILDPSDWNAFRSLGHHAVDQMVAGLSTLSENPAWRETPQAIREKIDSEPLPISGQGETAVLSQYFTDVERYANGNRHPRHYGWVEGAGIPFASIAEMLASALNPHMAGFNQAPVHVEKKVVAWMAELMGFPSHASGVLESGGTMANVLGLAVARHVKAGFDVREQGIQNNERPLTVYCSAETHSWINKAVELLGIGNRYLRCIPTNDDLQMDLAVLEDRIDADLRAGYRPIAVIGTAGTVSTGAFDDLHAIADLCSARNIWFHADAAFGAFLKLSPKHAHLVDGLERADSVALDLHKWLSLPFEIACALIKDDQAHTATFAHAPSYLAEFDRGLMAGGLPFSDRGMDLSRNFKALKAWMCLKAYGLESFQAAIERNMAHARLLRSLVDEHPDLEATAPSPSNIVCFRFRPPDMAESIANAANVEILLRVQESGEATPSSAVIAGKFSLRACMVNHRCQDADIPALVEAVVKHGRQILSHH